MKITNIEKFASKLVETTNRIKDNYSPDTEAYLHTGFEGCYLIVEDYDKREVFKIEE